MERELPERAELVHQIEGRMRLRIAARQGDEAFFAELAQKLASHAAVSEVRYSARTGGVLVLHGGAAAEVLDHLRASGVVTVAASPPSAPMTHIASALERAEQRLARATHTTATMEGLAFVGFVAGGLYQAYRGKLLPAGLTLFEYAWDVLRRGVVRETAEPAPGGGDPPPSA